jgi:hypothetical protein
MTHSSPRFRTARTARFFAACGLTLLAGALALSACGSEPRSPSPDSGELGLGRSQQGSADARSAGADDAPGASGARTARNPAALAALADGIDPLDRAFDGVPGGAWFKAPPDRDLGGLVTSEVLELYYGADFPRALESMGTWSRRLDEFDSWVRPPGDRLGEAGPSLEAIKKDLVERCRADLLLRSSGLDLAFAPRSGFRMQSARRAAAGAAASDALSELTQARQRLLEDLVLAAQRAVARDLEPVSLVRRPEIGVLRIGVALIWQPATLARRQLEHPSRWWITLSGEGGPRSAYLGAYFALLTDFPECRTLIDRILEVEARLQQTPGFV